MESKYIVLVLHANLIFIAIITRRGCTSLGRLQQIVKESRRLVLVQTHAVGVVVLGNDDDGAQT